jgi:hypothetical protein
MLFAGKVLHLGSAPHLMGVLTGQTPTTTLLPEVPPDEEEDVPEGHDDIAGKRPEHEVAALALGYLRRKEAAEVISKKKPSSPMYEVALALMGDVRRLRPEHFRGQEDNKELQLAAVEAVIRCKGRHGLKYAIDYNQATHWWEEEHVAKRLKRMLIAENAPGADTLRKTTTLADLAEWYKAHGAQYLRRQERR